MGEGTPANLEVGLGLPPDQNLPAAELLYEAFDHIFRPLFGSREVAVGYISENLVPERIVSATVRGSVIGLGALKYGNVEPVDYGFLKLLRYLGLGIFRFLLVGLVFVLESERKDELYLEMLAVDSGFRGRGVGGSIMEFVFDYARNNGFEVVSLHVIDTAEGARNFYRKWGFEERDYTKIFPWDGILGFKGVYEMCHEV
jgi:ribosomal protein S18 acetylase RimI-like enzyme